MRCDRVMVQWRKQSQMCVGVGELVVARTGMEVLTVVVKRGRWLTSRWRSDAKRESWVAWTPVSSWGGACGGRRTDEEEMALQCRGGLGVGELVSWRRRSSGGEASIRRSRTKPMRCAGALEPALATKKWGSSSLVDVGRTHGRDDVRAIRTEEATQTHVSLS